MSSSALEPQPSPPLLTTLPPPVRPGDRVGVAALSGPVDQDRLEAGLAALSALGFQPQLAENLRMKSGLFAGTDDERLEGFHRLAADPTVKAILFARGGHGVLRVLDRIDWPLLRRFPRAYVGYCDLTPFLLAVVERLGLVAFHGPMVAADLARGLTAAEQESLLGCLAGEFPRSLECRTLAGSGAVEGPILGGCLSLLTSLLGTDYSPRLAGALLFWEEVSEPPYRIDRMLTHLRLSDTLANIAGMVIGHITWPSAEEPEEAWSLLADDALSTPPWPLAAGLQAGHESPNLTLPLGLVARLDLERERLILGPALD
ncbi:MAG: LD-carboxypeptidase [Acidobacteria bacterium]|nr:LD-carboxypeptidase [Acidobacteriota bacterium]